MEVNEFSKEKSYLEKRYPDKVDLIENSIEDAIAIYCHLRNVDENEKLNGIEKNWIKRCADELLAMEEYMGAIKYSENGYSFERFENGLSPILIREIVPKVVVR